MGPYGILGVPGVSWDLLRLPKAAALFCPDASSPAATDVSSPAATLDIWLDTFQTWQRLSVSCRRCYWKSNTEMLFPNFFGHTTFAVHRCWTIMMKKGVFLA